MIKKAKWTMGLAGIAALSMALAACGDSSGNAYASINTPNHANTQPSSATTVPAEAKGRLSQLMNNLTSSAKIAFSQFQVGLDLNGTAISIASDDLVIDYLENGGNPNIFSGTLDLALTQNGSVWNQSVTVQYNKKALSVIVPQATDANGSVIAQGGTYNFTVSAIGDAIYLILKLAFPANEAVQTAAEGEDASQSLDFLSVLSQLQDKVDQAAANEIANPDGSYSYPFDLGNGNGVTLTGVIDATHGLRLSGFAVGSPMALPNNAGTLTALSGTVSSYSFEEGVTGDVTVPEGNTMDGLIPLFVSISNIMAKKQVASAIKITKADADGSNVRTADLELAGDFSNPDDKKLKLSTKPLAEGESWADKYIKGTAEIVYANKTAYVNVAGTSDDSTPIKGYMDLSDMASVTTVYGQATQERSTASALDAIGILFGNSDFAALLKGDVSKINGLVQSLTTTSDPANGLATIQATLFAKYFGLVDDPTAIVTLTLTLKKDDNPDESARNYIQDIRVFGLPIQGAVFDIDLPLESGYDFNSIQKPSDLNGYANFSAGLPAINSIIGLANDKKGTFDLGLTVRSNAAQDGETPATYQANGTISADLTPALDAGLLDASDTQSTIQALLQSDLAIGLNASLTAKDGTARDLGLDARFVHDDQAAYFAYQAAGKDIAKEKMATDTVLASVGAVFEGLKSLQGQDSSAGGSSAPDVDMTPIAGAVSKIFTIQEGLDLEALTKIFQVSQDKDGNLVLTIAADQLGLTDFGTVSVTLKNDDGERKFLKASVALTYQSYSVTFDIDQTDYVGPKDLGVFGKADVKFDEYYKDLKTVTDFHFFVTGIFDVLNPKGQYGATIDAAYGDQASIKGSAAFDFDQKAFDGQLVMNLDSNNYDPAIYFRSQVDPTTQEKSVEAIYTHENSDGSQDAKEHQKVGIKMPSSAFSADGTIGQLMAEISNASQNALLGLFVVNLNSSFQSIPLMTAIQNRDAAVLLSDLVTNADIDDGSVSLTLSSKMLGVDATDKDGNPVDITVKVTYAQPGVITGLFVNAFYVAQKELTLSIQRVDYQAIQRPDASIFEGGTIQWIDFDSLPLLLKLGLNTTNKLSYEFDGSFTAKLPVISDLTASFKAYVNIHPVSDTNPSSYIDVAFEITPTKADGSIGPVTQFGFATNAKDDIVIRKGNVIHKVSSAEFQKNFVYYVFGMGLDFEGNDDQDPIGYQSLLVSEVTKLMGQGTDASDGTSSLRKAADPSAMGESDQGGLFGTAFFPEDLLATYRYDADNKEYAIGLGAIGDVLPLPKGLSIGNDIALSMTHYGASENDVIRTISVTSDRLISVVDSVSVGIDLSLTNVVSYDPAKGDVVNDVDPVANQAVFNDLAQAGKDLKHQVLTGVTRDRKVVMGVLGETGESYWYVTAAFADDPAFD